VRRTAPVAALLAAALGVAGLAACDATSGTADARRDTATSPLADPSASPTPSGAASLPAEDDAPTDPDDPALDVALSEPVEDSYYPDVGDPSVDALHYDLDLAWTPDTRTLEGRATVDLRSTATGDHLQLDLGAPLEVAAVTLDGADVPFTHDGDHLVVSAPVSEDERYELQVQYAGTPEPTPAPTTRSDFSTSGWTTTPTGASWTMQEPYGAFTWYPVNDQPSDKALYDISVTVPSPWVGVANGELVDQSDDGGLTTTRWHLSSPASSYLVTVATGDYTRTTNTSSSGVEISYWVPSDRPELADRLHVAAAGLDWLEERLGPYPFDSLGFLLVDSQSGMETQTMITLGLTDYATSPEVLVHEMAHQWYGDEVTPDDWSDVWMNEGMAMFIQGAWQADDAGVDIETVMDDYASVEPQLRAQSGPPAAYDKGEFGESNVYYGPAVMYDELRKRIGDEKFWQVVRDWPARDPMTNADRDVFLDWWVQETGVDRQFFEDWLLSPTSPERSQLADS
jgi:aminopeptidase N